MAAGPEQLDGAPIDGKRLRDRASISLKGPLGGGAEGKSRPASAEVIYREEPEDAGGLGQIGCDGCGVCDVCGGPGQTDCDVWDCGALVGGGAGQPEASGCCAAGFCVGPTVMRVGAGADAASARDRGW